MKLLIVIGLLMLAVWGVVYHHFPQVGSSLPFLGSLSSALDDTGVSSAPGKLLDAGKDLSKTASSHHFGGWHLAVIVMAVLLGRKALMMLLR